MSEVKLEFTNNTWIADDDTVTVKHFSGGKQVHYNSNPQNHIAGYKRLDKNTYLNPITGKVETYKQNESKVLKNVATQVKRGRDILINHFSGHQNVLFFTLTFKKAYMDMAGTQDYFNKFLKKLKRRYGKLIYFYVIELQKERQEPSLHIHAAIKRVEYKRFKVDNPETKALWGQGSTKTKRLYDVEKISNYFFKDFFREENLKIYPKGSNIYYRSKGLEPPTLETLTMSEFLSKYEDDYYLDNSTAADVIDSKTNKIMCSNVDKFFKPRKYKRKDKKKFITKRAVRFIKMEADRMVCDDIYVYTRRYGYKKSYGVKVPVDTENTVLMDKIKHLQKRKKQWVLLETTFPVKYGLVGSKVIDLIDEKDMQTNYLF